MPTGKQTPLTRVTRKVHQSHFLLEVWPTKQSSRANHKLVTLFQLPATRDAREARQVIHVVQCSHHEVRLRYRLQASVALCSEQSVRESDSQSGVKVDLPTKRAQIQTKIQGSRSCSRDVRASRRLRPLLLAPSVLRQEAGKIAPSSASAAASCQLLNSRERPPVVVGVGSGLQASHQRMQSLPNDRDISDCFLSDDVLKRRPIRLDGVRASVGLRETRRGRRDEERKRRENKRFRSIFEVTIILLQQAACCSDSRFPGK